VTVNKVDTDGDETETLGTFAAEWAGGQACYVNLYETGGEDASEVWSGMEGAWVAGPTECLHIGDPAEDRSLKMATERLVSWLQDYADHLDGSDWDHDASHYGFPS
jgi:hypothetical protein